MCKSGSGEEAPKHVPEEASVGHVDLLCLFLLAFWEGFCGRASEYKRVTTAKNNNRTFCQEALSVVLCDSHLWQHVWKLDVYWVSRSSVSGLCFYTYLVQSAAAGARKAEHA